ncbi:hypothetical protein IPF37_04555 [bacterium]|nr:MAG: hypothetical protein IPF37_04555 [bacterium]
MCAFRFVFNLLLIASLVARFFCPQEVFMIQELAASSSEKLLERSSLMWWLLGFSLADFMLHGGFLLFVRQKSDDKITKNYLFSFMLRYIQYSLIFSLVMLMLVVFFASLGMTALPHVHWSVVMMVRSLELIMLFFWFDSPCMVKDFFKALEKGVNFVLYNLPFLLIFLILGLVSQFVLKLAVCGLSVEYADIFAFLNGRLELVAPITVSDGQLAIWRVLLFKYLKFMLDFFWICFLWVVYDRKKMISYANSFFS